MPNQHSSHPLDRAMDKVEVDSKTNCWVWQPGGARGRYKTYGQFWLNGTNTSAHVSMFNLTGGEIPEGKELDHLCKNTLCVNPGHLEPVTHGENLLRGNTFQANNAAKTECSKGHPFNPENTYIAPDGSRDCRTCRSDAVRRFRNKSNMIGVS